MPELWTNRLRAVLLIPAAAIVTACLGEPEGPGVIPQDTVAYRAVHAGAFHACGLTADGQAYCWGSNTASQLGVGDFEDRAIPQRVFQEGGYIGVALGGAHSCGVTSGDRLECWGSNDWGQLGVGIRSGPEGVPTPVTGDLQFTVAASGGQHTCGLTSGGEAWCWGLGESGQLGDGTTGLGWFRASPDSVRGGFTFDSLTAGSQHTCALTLDSRAYCWGAGSSGQLGIGETGSRDLPTPVAGNQFFFQIDAGGAHTCGLTLDGDGYCWGKGESGQLGTGSISDRDTPTLVEGGLVFQSISTGASHTCGVTGAGDTYCWGANESGQLGDGTVSLRLQPTEVRSDDVGFVRVEAGMTHTCGLGTDGIVYCWGFGGGGQIGDGEYQNALTPTRVAGQLEPSGP